MPDKQLLLLAAKLLESAELRREFNADPEAVADRLKLTHEEKAALFSMNLLVIGAAIQQQVFDIDYKFLKGEFPITGHMFVGELDETKGEYPDPTPQVFRFFPKDKPAGSGKFELNVYGQSFTKDAEIVLTPVGGGVPLTVKGHRVFGTYRCSHARGVVTPPVAKGFYWLQIQNGAGLTSRPALIPPNSNQAPKFEFN